MGDRPRIHHLGMQSVTNANSVFKSHLHGKRVPAKMLDALRLGNRSRYD